METHFRTLGIAHLVYAILILIPAIFIFTILSGIGFVVAEPNLMAILTTIGFFVSGYLTLLAIPGILAGYGLMNQKSWALPLALVIGVFNIFCFPFGTALGAYSIWVFMEDRDRHRLAATAKSEATN